MKFQKNIFSSPGLILLLTSLFLAGCYATTNLHNEQLNYVPGQESLSRGHDLYQDYCQECHGSDLTGSGPRASTLEEKPANLKEKSLHFTFTAIKGVIDYPHYSRETIEDKVQFGNDIMPPLKDILSDEDIRNLTDYISTEIRSDS